MLAAEGLLCGSRVGLWRADLAQNSRMIRGIRVSRGPLGLMSYERKGVWIAGLQLHHFFFLYILFDLQENIYNVFNNRKEGQ